MKEVMEPHRLCLFLSYINKGFRSYANMRVVPRDYKTDVYIFYGPGGSGKSALAKLVAKNKYGCDIPYMQNGGKWWPRFTSQDEVVIVDDFKGPKNGSWDWEYWKQICDRYGFSIEGKGTNTEFKAKALIFTTNRDPTQWFSKEFDAASDWTEQGLRRVENMTYCSSLAQTADGFVQDRFTMHGDDKFIDDFVPKQGSGKFWEFIKINNE